VFKPKEQESGYDETIPTNS